MTDDKKQKKKKPFVWVDPERLGSAKPIPGRCGVKLNGRDAYCQRHPMKRGNRCWVHRTKEGGTSHGGIRGRPKGSKTNQPTTSDTFYSDALLPGEETRYDMVKVGELDDELMIARLQLRRLLKVQQAFELAASDPNCIDEDGFVLVEVQLEQQGLVDENGNIVPRSAVTKKIRRKNDYTDQILKFTKLISTLEASRAEILRMKPPSMENTPLSDLAKAIAGLRGEIFDATSLWNEESGSNHNAFEVSGYLRALKDLADKGIIKLENEEPNNE